MDRTPLVGSPREAQGKPAPAQRLALYLIKPSRYDDEGYVIRHFRGLVPSNTLAVLQGLTLDVQARGELGEIGLKVETYDEAVERIPYRRIRRAARREGTRVVIALCGVQTCQMPRVRDLAIRFRRAGCEVIIGGFHISGANALVPGRAPELQELLDRGAHLVRGEVEGRWGEILRRLAEGTLPPLTDLLDARPDLKEQPAPVFSRSYLRRFTLGDCATMDAGRGCPFNCSFCTVINVQGRKMRCRSPERVLAGIRRQIAGGARFFFFTDDNFSRHPEWRAIFDGLTAMRREGASFTFMMQVDTLGSRLPEFASRAKAAGCIEVFIGLESIRPANLAAAGKNQNLVADSREMIGTWRRHGILTNCGYILGFPGDTAASIAEDVRRLRDEIQPDLVSFFILTPLPGSLDHYRLVTQGAALDPDLNRYDSLHVVCDHPRMSRAELLAAYKAAWREFYTVAHMQRALTGLPSPVYWSLFNAFLWARHACLAGEHPMTSGLHRFRHRAEMRAGLPRPGHLAHAWRRMKDAADEARLWGRLFLEMQEVWLGSRPRYPAEGRLGSILHTALTLRPAALLGHSAAWLNRHRYTRADLTAFWKQLNRFRWWRANPLKAPVNALRESALLVHFIIHVRSHGRHLAWLGQG